jgi:hypothetical protein
MGARHPDLVTFEVPDQGHTPLLVESDVIARIRAFIGRCEAARSIGGVMPATPAA